jgi:hypothetical protein
VTSGCGESSVLLRGACALALIGFAVWLIFSVSGYAERCAHAAQSWQIGGTSRVELTLTPGDVHGLGCASDARVEGLHCAYRADARPYDPSLLDDRHLLRPYNTVDRRLLLGAGLWSSPALGVPLPAARIAVACSFTVRGVVKSPSLRFVPDGPFTPSAEAIAVGTLAHCVIPP